MKRFYYDFHIHSCLSPCASDDMTPYNIAGSAMIAGLNMVALTDHNSIANCSCFFEACEQYGITAIPGVELTTAEDIHIVCLFENLSDADSFSRVIEEHRVRIGNRVDIFGNQLICGQNDEIIGIEPDLLPNATTLTIEEAYQRVCECNGFCYPAHIDRQSNGILAVLGIFPENPPFDAVEMRDAEKWNEYKDRVPEKARKMIFGSDSHFLESIPDAKVFLDLDACYTEHEKVRKELFAYLRSVR